MNEVEEASRGRGYRRGRVLFSSLQLFLVSSVIDVSILLV